MIKAIGLLIIGIIVVDAIVITYSFIQQGSKLNDASENASVLESQISAQNGELVTVRATIALLQSQLADSLAKASALQAELNTTEQNATILQQQIMNVPQIINPAQGPNSGVKTAVFTVDNVTITPGTTAAGHNVTVVVAVTNTGGQAGSYGVLLQIREYSQQIYDDRGEDINLAAGESGKVVFVLTLFDKGNYVLSVENIYHDLTVT